MRVRGEQPRRHHKGRESISRTHGPSGAWPPLRLAKGGPASMVPPLRAAVSVSLCSAWMRSLPAARPRTRPKARSGKPDRRGADRLQRLSVGSGVTGRCGVGASSARGRRPSPETAFTMRAAMSTSDETRDCREASGPGRGTAGSRRCDAKHSWCARSRRQRAIASLDSSAGSQRHSSGRASESRRKRAPSGRPPMASCSVRSLDVSDTGASGPISSRRVV